MLSLTVNSTTTSIGENPYGSITVDLVYSTSSGTTTGFNDNSFFDGRGTAVVTTTPAGITRNHTWAPVNTTFSTIGGQFSAPVGDDRFLRIGLLVTLFSKKSYNGARPALTINLQTLAIPSQIRYSVYSYTMRMVQVELRTFNTFFL